MTNWLAIAKGSEAARAAAIVFGTIMTVKDAQRNDQTWISCEYRDVKERLYEQNQPLNGLSCNRSESRQSGSKVCIAASSGKGDIEEANTILPLPAVMTTPLSQHDPLQVASGTCIQALLEAFAGEVDGSGRSSEGVS